MEVSGQLHAPTALHPATTVSRTALGPTQPPIQLVQGALSVGVKRPGREAGHSPPSSAEVKEWVELYIHSPNAFSWRGAPLKEALGQLYIHLYTDTWLDDRGSGVRLPAGTGNFSPHHGVQTGSGAHPDSYLMGTRGSFPGGKTVGAWSWPLTSV
jgi:hypothetical protein